MRILITGASGFAASHFLDYVLSETDDEVVLLSRSWSGRVAEILDSAPADHNWRMCTTTITHDLTMPVSPQTLAQIGDIDWMVCYASGVQVADSLKDPVPFIQNNVNIALQSMELARVLKPKGVIWISSDTVCGPLREGQKPHPEWALQLPGNPYSASKASQEAICFSYWRTYGVPVVIVRCMNMFGERQRPDKMIPATIRNILNGREAVIYTDAEGNSSTRDYLHARNLASGISFIMFKKLPYKYGTDIPRRQQLGIGTDRPDMYNVASGAVISNLRLAHAIAGIMGQELRYRLEDASASRAGHDPRYGLAPSRLSVMGWVPPVSFEESLERTVLWTLANQCWLLP